MSIKPCSTQLVQIIGHRGSAAPFPENTLEAILYGILSGARMIEIDLRLSKDKEVVLSHDENLSEITGNNLNISEKTWEELSQLPVKTKKICSCFDAGKISSIPYLAGRRNWDFNKNKRPFYYNEQLLYRKTFHLLRLKDVFKTVPQDIQFYLELKSSGPSHISERGKKLADKVISIMRTEKKKKQCLIMSFDQDIVQYMKKKYPSYQAGIILNSKSRLNVLIKNEKVKYDCVAANYKLLTKRNLQIIQNSGIPFIVWTVNSKRLWRKIASYRPLGIVTDYPEKFSKLIEQ